MQKIVNLKKMPFFTERVTYASYTQLSTPKKHILHSETDRCSNMEQKAEVLHFFYIVFDTTSLKKTVHIQSQEQ